MIQSGINRVTRMEQSHHLFQMRAASGNLPTICFDVTFCEVHGRVVDEDVSFIPHRTGNITQMCVIWYTASHKMQWAGVSGLYDVAALNLTRAFQRRHF
jgi:hypothetical protein